MGTKRAPSQEEINYKLSQIPVAEEIARCIREHPELWVFDGYTFDGPEGVSLWACNGIEFFREYGPRSGLKKNTLLGLDPDALQQFVWPAFKDWKTANVTRGLQGKYQGVPVWKRYKLAFRKWFTGKTVYKL